MVDTFRQEEDRKRRSFTRKMDDRSHRDAMNAAIRAQRERRNVPRSIAPEPLAGPKAPEPPQPRKSFLHRLRNK
jgi:hypothetical protein